MLLCHAIQNNKGKRLIAYFHVTALDINKVMTVFDSKYTTKSSGNVLTLRVVHTYYNEALDAIIVRVEV